MKILEWYAENIRNYYCKEFDQGIASGRIYHLSCGDITGYVLYNEDNGNPRTIIGFAFAANEMIALCKETRSSDYNFSLTDINMNKDIGWLDNGIILNGIRYNAYANYGPVLKINKDFAMKYEIFRVYNDISFSIDIDISKTRLQRLDTAPIKGTIRLKEQPDWQLILCSFFSLHNYLLNID